MASKLLSLLALLFFVYSVNYYSLSVSYCKGKKFFFTLLDSSGVGRIDVALINEHTQAMFVEIIRSTQMRIVIKLGSMPVKTVLQLQFKNLNLIFLN